MDVPTFRTLGLGWRLARAARYELRAWAGIYRLGRLERDSSHGRCQRTLDGLDSRPATRKVRAGWNAQRDSRTQCGTGLVRLPAGAGWVARLELGRRHP